MADRKQTPDILSEVLGGEARAPEPAPVPEPKPAPRRRSSTGKTGRRSKPKPPRWEYMEVVFRDYGGYRPRYLNGEEAKGWKRAPLIHEYLNQLGEQGWELVGVGGRHNDEMPAYFKRPKG
jgi:hypothetical protein